MCDLHREIVHDPRYANSDVLKEYRGRLWSRLTKVKGGTEATIGQEQSQARIADNFGGVGVCRFARRGRGR